MRILGISGSPRDNNISGTYKLVETVLKATGLEYDLVSIGHKTIKGCIACLGCVNDNICKIDDDFDSDLREKVINADAYVIGSPNYYSGITANTHAFFERLFQFRHGECQVMWGKLAVAVGVGGVSGEPGTEQIEKFLNFNFIDSIISVEGMGASTCYSCKKSAECKIGLPYLLYGEDANITPDMIPDVMKQDEVVERAELAGKKLHRALTEDYDRETVINEMKYRFRSEFNTSA
jgi:multimeric flavodoxin WrbA